MARVGEVEELRSEVQRVEERGGQEVGSNLESRMSLNQKKIIVCQLKKKFSKQMKIKIKFREPGNLCPKSFRGKMEPNDDGPQFQSFHHCHFLLDSSMAFPTGSQPPASRITVLSSEQMRGGEGRGFGSRRCKKKTQTQKKTATTNLEMQQ